LYEEIYEFWKKEKEIQNLQQLPKHFYEKITDYIKKIKEENRMLDKKTTKGRLLKKEFMFSKFMIKEVLLLRYKKIRESSIQQKSIKKKFLTEEEAKIYETFLPITENYQTFFKDILHGNLSTIEKDTKQEFIVLRFIKKVPALVGADLQTYGPYELEDIANLPIENARFLIKKGLAIKVDLKNSRL
jgi:DNA replication initiation complex subunit (GINS family)